LQSGYDIVVVDNFANSSVVAIERVKEITGKDFPFYEADVCDEAALDEICAKHPIDCIIHFAGHKAVGESVAVPLKYYANNLGSTVALLNVMAQRGIKHIIFSSSATVYNGANAMPLTEDATTGGCTNPYGWTKYMCEQIITDAMTAQAGGAAVLLRYFNPIGAHESGRIGEDPSGIPNNLFPYLTQTAAGRLEVLSVYGDDYDTSDGTGVRDYIHVTDLAAGHVAAVQYCANHAGTHVFNLGTGRGSSVLEMIKAFEQVNGVPVPYKIAPRRAGDLPTCYADPVKAQRVLGWKAIKTLEDACADSWRWQTNNPNGYK